MTYYRTGLDLLNFCWGQKQRVWGTKVAQWVQEQSFGKEFVDEVPQKLKYFNICETLFCPVFAVLLLNINLAVISHSTQN